MISKAFNHLATSLDSQKCIVKWSSGEFTSKNIGDVLNVYLFKAIFGKDIVSYKEVFNLGFPPVYSFIGSVLDNSAVRNLTVMGSGFKSESSPLKVLPKKVISCRGPLTREKLLQMGVKKVPEVYGDPAILLPEFYNPKMEKKYKMGIIPHYVDKDTEIVKKWRSNSDVKIIDVFSDIETFVKDIKSCEFTVSSSLHGVILSHAYGIPSAWVKLSEDLAGGGFKFQDYFRSLNLEKTFVNIEQVSTLNDWESQTFKPEMEFQTKKLLKIFKEVKI